jgi:outer membrane protein insertion porin family
MRQLEAAWFDGNRIERSKVRLRRLGYFEDVNIETPPVQGTPDEADVEVTVTERSTGQLLAGVGYSSADGVVFNASVSQQNIFGSGNALIAALNTSQVNRTISLAFTQPYWTVDGISRTLEVYQRNIDTASLAFGFTVFVVDRWRAASASRSPNRLDQRRFPAHESTCPATARRRTSFTLPSSAA